jgi:hypothetical protein
MVADGSTSKHHRHDDALGVVVSLRGRRRDIADRVAIEASA